jgi:hypothetical protein
LMVAARAALDAPSTSITVRMRARSFFMMGFLLLRALYLEPLNAVMIHYSINPGCFSMVK